MYQKYTGIILKKHPLGEADELLTIFTREHGKIRAKAPGARKIKSRLAGSLQSLNEIEFETAHSSASGGSGHSAAGRLPVIISVRVVTLNNYFREDLKKLAHALVGVETLYRLSPDEEKNEEIYKMLRDFFKKLGLTHDNNLIVRQFQMELLETLGYGLPINGHATGQELDRAIDHHLHEVMEREIKSNGFKKYIETHGN